MRIRKKKRHELRDGKIRVLYGHSSVKKLIKEPAVPPEVLFHGTSSAAAPAIGAEGLKPMGRQYVHLSKDAAAAIEVGKRKSGSSMLLCIRSGEAHREGAVFYEGNSLVWLADMVAPKYINQVQETLF